MMKWVLALAMVASLPAVASAQDAEAGKAVFSKCKACHSAPGEGAKNQVGPNLTGVVGRKAGTVADFAYSEPMKASGLTWDEATISEYLANPKTKVPGNKMVFAGLKDEADIKNVIAYLKAAK